VWDALLGLHLFPAKVMQTEWSYYIKQMKTHGLPLDNRKTTAYIQNWISQLQEDNRLIVQAAANAQKAVDSILGTTFESEAVTVEREEQAATSGFPASQPRNMAA
jgi:antirestriction protein ArdC